MPLYVVHFTIARVHLRDNQAAVSSSIRCWWFKRIRAHCQKSIISRPTSTSSDDGALDASGCIYIHSCYLTSCSRPFSKVSLSIATKTSGRKQGDNTEIGRNVDLAFKPHSCFCVCFLCINCLENPRKPTPPWQQSYFVKSPLYSYLTDVRASSYVIHWRISLR